MSLNICQLSRSADAASLARIGVELQRLRECPSLTGTGASIGWVHNLRTCTLNNMNLSQGCLVLILEGRKVLLANGEGKGAVESGELVFFPAGQHISCANTPAEGGEYLALTLFFNHELLERVRRHVPVEAGAAESLPPMSTPEDFMGDLARLMRSLETFVRLLPEESDPTLPLMQQEQIVYLLWKLGAPVFSAQHWLIEHIRALVENRPDEPWSVNDIAASLHMTERTLRRKLEKIGTSISELVRVSRLHRGLDMLMRKNMRVGEVALSCGYTSQSRFAERFREQFGIPPGEVLASRRERA